MKKLVMSFEKKFEILTERITIILGHSLTFFIAILIVICWITLDIAEQIFNSYECETKRAGSIS